MPRVFIYVGKDESSPGEITVRGLTFERDGEPVEVLDEAFAEGLSGNPEFEEYGDGPDYGDVDYDPDLEQVVASQTARITELETANELLVSENRELREQLGQTLPVEPPSPTDYTQSLEVDKTAETFSEIEASEDWSKAPHPTRIRWANALSEGQIRTAKEADDVILEALVERDQDNS